MSLVRIIFPDGHDRHMPIHKTQKVWLSKKQRTTPRSGENTVHEKKNYLSNTWCTDKKYKEYDTGPDKNMPDRPLQ